MAALGHAYAAAGRQHDAMETLSELQRVAQSRFVSPYSVSILHTALGQNSLALDCLEKAYQERDVWLIWLKVEPRFDRLRADTRFQDLLRSMQL